MGVIIEGNRITLVNCGFRCQPLHLRGLPRIPAHLPMNLIGLISVPALGAA